MAIRLKNLDLNTDGGRRHDNVALFDITANGIEQIIFVAPVACRVDYIDVYSGQAVLGASAAVMTMRVQLAGDSATNALVSRGTSATAANLSQSNELSANARYRLIPSANNSLTVGTPIEINFSQQGSGVMSAVLIDVIYTPYKHRETR